MDDAATGPQIVGSQVALGRLRPDLVQRHTDALNDAEVGWNIFGAQQTRTVAEEAAWLERESARADAVFFQVYRREAAGWEPIGIASLTEIDARRGTATFRLLIWDAAERGRGHGTEATRLVVEHAFRNLGMHNVMLTVYGWNDAARRVYERCGFREIGRRRQSAPREGRRWDVIYMDRLATDAEPG